MWDNLEPMSLPRRTPGRGVLSTPPNKTATPQQSEQEEPPRTYTYTAIVECPHCGAEITTTVTGVRPKK